MTAPAIVAAERPPVALIPPLGAIHAELARRSLAEFVKHSWQVLEPDDPLVWSWHMQAVCDHVQALLEGRIPKRNVVINIPPGSSKSRIVSVCAPAWMWIHRPGWRAIFSSTNPRVTTRDSSYCRNLLESRWYRESFQPKWVLVGDQNTKTLYRNSAQGFRQAVSAGARVTGDRAHALFIDDPLDAALAMSDAARAAVIHWYDHAFANRLSHMRTGTRCLIMQRLHEEDLTGHVLKSGDWEHLCIPQEYVPPKKTEDDPEPPKRVTAIGWSDPRNVAGELLHEERFPAVELEKEKKRLGSAGYAGQHQQDPEPAGGQMLKRAWWKFYKKPEGTPQQIIAALGITRVAVGGDTALSEEQSADDSSFHAIGEVENRFYVLDHHKEKMAFPELQRFAVNFAGKWPPAGMPIEGHGSASGKAIVQALKKETRLPVIEVPNIDKVVRVARISPTVEAGVVYLPEGEPWVEDFIRSCAIFPRGAHDDDVDSFAVALDWLKFGESTTGLLEYYARKARQMEERKKKERGES